MANSVDALVWGTLQGLERSYDPAVPGWSDAAGDWASECRSFNPAVILSVDVEEVLMGPEELQGPLSVYIGPLNLHLFNPSPYWDEDGELQWPSGEGYGEPLKIGGPIGLPIHFLEEFDLWSLMFEPVLTLDGEGHLRMRGNSDECGEAFQGIEGRTAAELFEEAAGCPEPSATSKARRAIIRESFGNSRSPENSVAAVCFRNEPPEVDPRGSPRQD